MTGRQSSLTTLTSLLQAYVDAGALAGATALVAQGSQVEVAVVGARDVERAWPMGRDTIVRAASITKPVTAAAVLLLVQDGTLALDDPITTWTPELADVRVMRRPDGPVDDTVPAMRAITVRDVLTSRCGWGFPSEFSWPTVELLVEKVQPDGRDRDVLPSPDEWLRHLAEVPLLFQPGDGWLYNTSYDLLGVLVERASGRPFDDFLNERIFTPLGMVDTGFAVPAAQLHRLSGYYRPSDGGLELVEGPADWTRPPAFASGAGGLAGPADWTRRPAFASGAGGLVTTLDDWAAFGRMLLSGGRRLLSAESLALMMTDHLTPSQRRSGALFLEGQGWGFGGSVDVAPGEPWVVPGRYGWVGGTGTSAHVVPHTGSMAILLTQLEMQGPVTPGYLRDFWTYARG